MKKSKKLLISLIAIVTLLFCFAFGASAEAEVYFEGYYSYTVTDGAATVVGFDGNVGGDEIIPDTLGGYPVVAIGSNAFYRCYNLTSIVISENIVTIGAYAFRECFDLVNITIPNSVKSIGEYAFYECYSLESVIIPDSVKSIASNTFYFCRNLKSVIIPDSVTNIGDGAFYYCSSLESITIPYGVTSIEEDTFSGCTSLKSVTIPDSVTSIGHWAFWNCNKLESITIPNSVTSIGAIAFFYCESLESITIPYSVTSIGNSAFGACTNLDSITVDENNEFFASEDGVLFNKDKTELIRFPIASGTTYVIPDSVIRIGNEAFEYCKNLTNVIIPDTVTSIGSEAFFGCESLTEISIPHSITGISYHVFNRCEHLESIIVDEKNEFYSSENGVLFNKDKTSLIKYPAAKNETAYIIPNAVTSIEEYAFDDCLNLVSIIVPDSVTSIRYNAFDDCNNLKNVHYCGAWEQWNTVFVGGYNGCLVDVIHMETDKNADGICDLCNYVMYHVHSYTAYTNPPTCTENGTINYVCSCGDSYSESVPATGHSYGNDNICDNCGDNRSDDCSCNCHKSGFSGFIWKILRIFYKLFKINTVCSCGAAHY